MPTPAGNTRCCACICSALRDDFDPTRSDLDLLVEFQPIESGALVQAYFGLERQFASKQLIYEA